MILNETYDAILERLNNKYGITSINEGLFSKKKEEKFEKEKIKYFKRLQQMYESYIEKPFEIGSGNSDMWIVLFWNNIDMNSIKMKNKIKKYMKLKSFDFLKAEDDYCNYDDIFNFFDKVYFIISEDDYYIIMTPDNKYYKIDLIDFYAKISPYNFSEYKKKTLDYAGVEYTKEEFYNYINK